MDDASPRLSQLAQILSDARRPGDGPVADLAEHLSRVRLQRIQHLTEQLAARSGRDADDVDVVAMRLLLDQYAGTVVHLRAVAREGAKTLAHLAAAVTTERRRVDQQLEEKKRLASAVPSDQQPASQNPDT